MEILVINPNTSGAMTKEIKKTVSKIKLSNVENNVVNPDFGPESLESFYDYSLASFGCIRVLNKIKKYDGVLIACFGDPGLYAIKEKSQKPVIGIAEASLSFALLLGKKFSILVASNKAVPMMEDMVTQYGLKNRLASIETIGMKVLELEDSKKESVAKLVQAGEKAIKLGGEVLILGCAGMTDLKGEVEKELNVPIIDPVEIGYKMMEIMLLTGLNTSKKGIYQTPFPKETLQSDLLH